MINVMENKVLGPMIQRELDKSEERGMEQGMEQGIQKTLTVLLSEKFGALPVWAEQRLSSASSDELNSWTKRILRAATLEEVLQ